MKRAHILVFLPLLLTACEFSLAGDITPPSDAIISRETTLAPVTSPAAAPDLAVGAEIYANRCAPCHGLSGLGDGVQAAQLPFFPSAIGDPELARAASPEDWFRIISFGRLQRFMPPFESALTEQERWDVLAYVYGLGWDEEILARGEELIAEYRLEIDELMADIPSLSMKLNIVDGLTLSDEDAQALTAYLQAKALGLCTGEERIAEAPLFADGDGTTIFGKFSGQVIYGSGDKLPSDLEARLYGFDHTDQIVSEITSVSPNGSFAFTEIPLATDRIFFVQVDFKGLSFFSEFLTVDGQAGTYGLDVPIYDSTTETSQLAVERLQFLFDFPQVGVIRVIESVTISNLGDRAVAPDESGQPVLHFSLPPQASNLAFDEGELESRYVPDETGFGDTRAVIPGIHSREMYIAYDLPYNNELDFSIPIDLATRQVVVILPDNFELLSEGLQLQGKQEVIGTNYLVYSGIAGYLPGDEIPVQLSGEHPLGGIGGLLQDDSLLIGLAALTAAVGFAWLWLRRLPMAGSSAAEQTMAEIVALDQRYERGKIAKSIYTKNRNFLKARLRGELGDSRK